MTVFAGEKWKVHRTDFAPPVGLRVLFSLLVVHAEHSGKAKDVVNHPDAYFPWSGFLWSGFLHHEEQENHDDHLALLLPPLTLFALKLDI